MSLSRKVRFVDEKALDLQIRENYINIYDGRVSILKLKHLRTGSFRVDIHQKYQPPDEIAPEESGTNKIARLEDDQLADWAGRFVAAIPELQRNAAQHDKDEGRDEFSVVMTNRDGPCLVLDRQSQIEGVTKSKVDLIAASIVAGSVETIMFMELKREKSGYAGVMEAVPQVAGYAGHYAPEGKLREDVAASLLTVAQQKCELGVLQALPPGTDLADAEIKCAVAMVLPRGMKIERVTFMPQPTEVWFTRIDQGEARIPEPSRWHLIAEATGATEATSEEG